MKQLYFLLFTLCFFNGLNAQVINFSDVNFKAKLLKASSNFLVAKDLSGNFIKIDINNDGEIQNSEALVVSELYVDNYNSATSDKILNLDGIQYFINLKTLSCADNLLESLNLSNLIQLESLKLYKNKLRSLNINGLISLRILNCLYNQLTSLDVKDFVNMTELSCSNNLITELNLKNCKKLTTLMCESNSIEKLDLGGLSELVTLYCTSSNIKFLNLEGLNKLKTLQAASNPFTSLDLSSLGSVEEIIMFGGKLISLDVYELHNLKRLIISTNTDLNKLNLSGLTNLSELECDSDNLESLDVTGLSNLYNINCRNNKLKSINLSGTTKLRNFYGANNLLTTINFNDSVNLSWAECDQNTLKEVFIKNGKVENIFLSKNPDLKYICADEIDLPYLDSNRKNFGLEKCEINTYCSFEPGGMFYTFSGKNKLDEDNNGCNLGDPIFKNLKFQITSANLIGSTITDDSGNFNIPLSAGTYNVKSVLEKPEYFNVFPSSINFTLPSENNIYLQDYCISYNGLHPDLEIVLLELVSARPGFESKYKIVCINKGTTFQTGTIDLKFNDDVLDYLDSDTALLKKDINNLSWNFINLKPFGYKEITFTLRLNKPTDTPAINNGDILKFTAAISSQDKDETPNDNTFTLTQKVVGSFDPNDKTCLEGSVITPNLIGEYVHYIIRFENKGTYAAQNIVVKDMIDLSKFDISTLIPTSSSHPFITNISKENKVEFIFENINLPFDDANNDGYIAFKIKTKPTLVVGDSFTNDANIYFDYNFPILTNKALSTFKSLGTQDFEFSNYFTLYPNPVSSVLNITSTHAIEVESLAIYDILGQLVIAVPNAKSVSNIDVSKLKTGNYFIKVKSDKGISSMKFIKQ